MKEYKNYALVINGRITTLVRSTVAPIGNKYVEVIELTEQAFADLAYN